MKKWLMLLAALLVLTGCTQQAALVTTAVKESLDVTSQEASTTFRLSTNVDLAAIDPTLGAVAELLEAGIVVKQQVKSDSEAHLTVLSADPESLKGTDLWPFDTDPGLDLYLSEDQLAIKTTADDKFLGFPTESAGEPVDPGVWKQHVRAFLDGFAYPLKDARVVGEETIEVNGQDVTATHVQIQLDFAEAVSFAQYLLEQLSAYPDLDELAGSLGAGVDGLPAEGLDTGLGAFTAAGADAFAADEEDEFLAEEGDELPATGPADLAEALKDAAAALELFDVNELKSQGWDLNISLDYWINADKRFIQDQFRIALKAPGDLAPELELPAIELTLEGEGQYWNHNGTVSYPVPKAADVITLGQLAEEPELIEAFPEGSPLRAAAEAGQPVEEEPFADLPESHWAYDEIMGLRMLGIVDGYGDGTFHPDRTVTRAEFVKMAVNALGIEPQSAPLTFKDKASVPAWAEEYVQTAVEAGLIKGYDDGTFRPQQKITRAEMVTILVRGMELPLEDGYTLSYQDAKTIPAWAAPYVKTATAYELVNGRPGNRFAPAELTTRAEVSAVLYRILFGPEE